MQMGGNMLLQEFVRGMRGLREEDAKTIMSTGLMCQAMWRAPNMSLADAEALLTDENLDLHRHNHDAFAESSPYISTSAGTYREGSARKKYNQPLFAFETALEFAVLSHRTDGWIFYGYHFVLGRPSGRHVEFAEEVRDLHQHPQWSRFRGEGEIAAALRIPPRRLRLAEFYTYQAVMDAINADEEPAPEDIISNDGVYMSPETVLSARGVI